jgi:hypothetical protein
MTPLPIACPPWSIVRRIYREARSAVKWTGGRGPAEMVAQDYLRKVSAEFHRQLADRGFYVEE